MTKQTNQKNENLLKTLSSTSILFLPSLELAQHLRGQRGLLVVGHPKLEGPILQDAHILGVGEVEQRSARQRGWRVDFNQKKLEGFSHRAAQESRHGPQKRAQPRLATRDRFEITAEVDGAA